MTTTDNTRYFINGKEVTANRYAAMKRLNSYIGRKISRGQMEAPTRVAWYTYEAAADAEYGIARYLENCKRFGYLNEEETEPATDTPANESEAKTMQEIENQAYRLTEMNWRRKNVWESSEASKAAKNSRDRLICKAYLNAAAKHLTKKAKAISEFLSVKPMHSQFCVMLDYNSPAVGMGLKVGSPFCVEDLLNNPDKVLALINV